MESTTSPNQTSTATAEAETLLVPPETETGASKVLSDVVTEQPAQLALEVERKEEDEQVQTDQRRSLLLVEDNRGCALIGRESGATDTSSVMS